MIIRHPITISSVSKGDLSDFGIAPEDSTTVLTTIGAIVRDVSNAEKAALSLELNQSMHVITLLNTPITMAIEPGSHRIGFDDNDYEVLSVNNGRFSNFLGVEVMIGRNS